MVLGMHRSGTSAMARVLSLCGADLPGTVIGPADDNPTGYWEPRDMVVVSDALLSLQGSAWDDPFAGIEPPTWEQAPEDLRGQGEAFLAQAFSTSRRIVLKDPRASVLLPFWRSAVEGAEATALAVIMVRHPLEVAQSLKARDGAPLERGLSLWLAYMLAAERDTRDMTRVFVSYDQLLQDWRTTIGRIEAAGARGLGRLADAAAIDAYLNRDQRHHQATAVAEADFDDVFAVHELIVAASGGAPLDIARLDAIGARLAHDARRYGPAIATLRKLAGRAEGIQSDLETIRREKAEALSLLAHTQAWHHIAQGELDRERLRQREHVEELDDLRRQVAEFRLGGDDRALIDAQIAIGRAETRALREAARAGELEAALHAEQARLESIRESAALEHEATRAELQRQLDWIYTDAAGFKARLDEAQRHLDQARQRIVRMSADPGWKLGRPYRVLKSRLKRSRPEA